MLIRKVTATFTTTILFSIILAGWFVKLDGLTPNDGNYLIFWTMTFGSYMGAIILTYGNLVSFFIEWLQGKWHWINHLVYILLHGVFGLANGLLFESWMLGCEGAAAAIIYALIDRWVYFRQRKEKGIQWFYILPIVVYLLTWGVLEWAF
ncbi:hypothetical protein [Falsibacillus pallidus]|uniref:Uncharacterized protein n=1 Tax=Falsibacillus pallidus TaxID=493781 RepID=A0A370GSN7_9BACI|nr:hypothetical protein [Falsibacillus pallidus]RDI45534.1 hypothetical protein DFR59_102162 [Falsibacillus pallidus]